MPMRTLYFSTLFFLLYTLCYAQLESAHWYFGQYAGLDFSSGEPVVVFDGALETGEGCASISDPEGNLLFYTDGRTVFNRNHTVMPNGSFLMGDSSSTQSAIIVPMPGDLNQYFIFTVGADDNAYPGYTENEGFHYYLVDMSLENGLGDILPYNNTANELLELTSEKITAVANGDNNGYWIITHFEDKFYSYLVDDSGINTTPVISQIGPYLDPDVYPVNSRGYIKASPDGKKIAVAHLSNLLLEDIPQEIIDNEPLYTNNTFANTYNGFAAVYQFNDQTGVISNEVILSEVGSPYGLEFSFSSDYLYFEYDYHVQYPEPNYGEWIEGTVVQYDLNSADIANSGIIIFNDFTPNAQLYMARGALQLALDEKIYYTPTLYSGQTYYGDYLSIIHSPDSPGTAANFEYNALRVNDAANQYHKLSFGLPPFITSFFRASIEFEGEILNSGTCLGNEINFSINSNQEVLSVSWDFGDGNTSNELNPTHTYANPGTYLVSATIQTSEETLTINRSIQIHPFPNALNAELVECDFNGDGIALFDLNEADNLVTNQPENTISYHLTSAEANLGENPLTGIFINTTNPQTIYVRINSPHNCPSFSELILRTDLFTIQEVSDIEKCDLESDGVETFDLESRVDEIESLYTETVTVLSFHETAYDAEMNENQLPNSIQNSSNPQTIFARVQTSGCIEVVSFQLILHDLPFVDVENIAICPDGIWELDAGSGFSSYQWMGLQGTDQNQPLDEQTITVSIPGEYSLIVKNDFGCEYEDFFTVSIKELPVIQEIVVSQNGTATITAQGDPPFEYSLDGIFWQSSNVFYNLLPGDYTVYIKDATDCISLKDEFGILEIPNLISPNGDGKNDNWTIRGIASYPDVHIQIFDRYGKLFYDRMNHNNTEIWDGKYLGRVVNSGSYWYIIKITDGRKYVGYLEVRNY